MIFLNFQNIERVATNICRRKNRNSLHLTRKYGRVFVLGHYRSSKLTVFFEITLGKLFASLNR